MGDVRWVWVRRVKGEACQALSRLWWGEKRTQDNSTAKWSRKRQRLWVALFRMWKTEECEASNHPHKTFSNIPHTPLTSSTLTLVISMCFPWENTSSGLRTKIWYFRWDFVWLDIFFVKKMKMRSEKLWKKLTIAIEPMRNIYIFNLVNINPIFNLYLKISNSTINFWFIFNTTTTLYKISIDKCKFLWGLIRKFIYTQKQNIWKVITDNMKERD